MKIFSQLLTSVFLLTPMSSSELRIVSKTSLRPTTIIAWRNSWEIERNLLNNKELKFYWLVRLKSQVWSARRNLWCQNSTKKLSHSLLRKVNRAKSLEFHSRTQVLRTLKLTLHSLSNQLLSVDLRGKTLVPMKMELLKEVILWLIVQSNSSLCHLMSKSQQTAQLSLISQQN